MFPIGRDNLAKIVRTKGLKVGRKKSRKPKTTYSGHNYAVQPNLMHELEVNSVNELWVADITHISLRKGSSYLFLITDAYSRMVLGHYLSESLSHKGAIEALQRAIEKRGEPKKVIHHSDRGVQYCCHNFIDEIDKWKLQLSMTDGDHCAQNALAECMNGILKSEFYLDAEFRDFNQAKAAVEDAIFSYNHLRIHGALEGKTPAEVQFGRDGVFEQWAKEIVAFHAPLPNRLIASI
jgi:transposase InsO family protein